MGDRPQSPRREPAEGSRKSIERALERQDREKRKPRTDRTPGREIERGAPKRGGAR